MEKLLEIAKQIMAANKSCLLSGSVALKLQGVAIMREPKDIDIYLPVNVEFAPIPGMKLCANEDNAEYPEDGWERQEYSFDGVKVDVFTPDYVDTMPDYELESVAINGINCINKCDIIKFKASHAFGDHWTRYKHRNDIVF